MYITLSVFCIFLFKSYFLLVRNFISQMSIFLLSPARRLLYFLLFYNLSSFLLFISYFKVYIKTVNRHHCSLHAFVFCCWASTCELKFNIIFIMPIISTLMPNKMANPSHSQLYIFDDSQFKEYCSIMNSVRGSIFALAQLTNNQKFLHHARKSQTL